MKITGNFKNHILLGSCILLFSCGERNNKNEGIKTADSLANVNLNEMSHNVDSPKNNAEYKVITINDQTWMVENLNVSVFLNGDSIPEVKNSNDWLSASKNGQPACCYYNNITNSTTGKLYNWFAINDKRGLIPVGWKIPSNKDFDELTKNLGGEKIAGAKLKSSLGWSKKGKGTNESGFTAIPSGMRQFNGNFQNINDYSYLWTSTERKGDNAWYFGLNDINSIAKTFFSQKGNGFSIRCIKN